MIVKFVKHNQYNLIGKNILEIKSI